MRDSAEILTDPPPAAADARVAYGPEPLQFGDLRVPSGEGPFPLALVLHGGYWQATYNLIHTGHLCEALRDAGIASWNLEYRCLGVPGGEWPAAREDLERALAHLDRAALRPRRPHRARRPLRRRPARALGGEARRPSGRRARAGLRRPRCRRASRPRSAPGRFMAPEHFADGSPLELLPLGAPPDRDPRRRATTSVPYAMSERYVAAADGEAELVTLRDTGHFEPIDPHAPQFAQTLAAIEKLL